MAELRDDPFDESKPAQQNEFLAQLNDPRVRGALLQMGLQMLQPLSVGQSQAGNFAQGIGAGGDFVNRVEKMDLTERAQDEKTDVARERLYTQQQLGELRNTLGLQQLDLRRANAETAAEQRARRLDQHGQEIERRGRDLDRKTMKDLLGRTQRDARDFDLWVRDQAKGIERQLSEDAYVPKEKQNPALQQWRGKSRDQIARELAEDPTAQESFLRRRNKMSTPAPAAQPGSAGVDPDDEDAAVEPKSAWEERQLSRARAAIKSGTGTKENVIRHLRANGIDPSRL